MEYAQSERTETSNKLYYYGYWTPKTAIPHPSGYKFNKIAWRASTVKDMKSAGLSPEPTDDSTDEETIKQIALLMASADLLNTALNEYNSSLAIELDAFHITKEGDELLNYLIDKPHSGFTSRASPKRHMLKLNRAGFAGGSNS